MLNKINLLFLAASIFLPFDRVLSMDKKRKTEAKSCNQKEKNRDQNEERPKKIRKIDDEDREKLQAFLDLPDNIRLQILQNLPNEAKLYIFNQTDEELTHLVTLSTLADEVQLGIISAYLLASFFQRKANIKSTYDIDRFVKRQSLAHVSKKFRELSSDRAIKLSLIKEFVQENPKQAVNDLVDAVYNANVQMVEDLIKAGTDVNGIGVVSYCSMTLDVERTIEALDGRIKYKKELCELKGAPLKFAIFLQGFDCDNDTNSYITSNIEVDDKPNVKIVRALLEAGANPNLRSAIDDLELSPLLLILRGGDIDEGIDIGDIDEASRDQIVLMLLKYGANPNHKKFDDQNTPLYYAIEEKYYKIIKYLLDYGANPFVKFTDTCAENWVEQPLMMLIEKDESLKEIIKSYSYKKLLFDSIKNKDAQTFMALMFYKKHSKLPNFNINAQDENGYTALMIAADNSMEEYVWYLLVHEADPNIVAKDGKTALSIAQDKEKVNSRIISVLKSKSIRLI